MVSKTPALTLQFLGGADIRLDDAPVTGFATQKVLALFVYLAVTRQPHTRDHLDTLLWGNLADAAARRALRYALWNLRRLLGPYLIVTPQYIAFDINAPHTSDVLLFSADTSPSESETLAPEQIRSYRRALDLYRGEFLRGLHVREAEEFDAWMFLTRERFHRAVLDILPKLVAHETAKQNYARGIDYARRWLEVEAWNEDAHHTLIRLHISRGDTAAAWAQYETCRRVLSEELNAEPGEATLALMAELRAAAPPVPEPAPPLKRHNLPVPRTPFFGRETEIARILEKMRDPSCHLLTLTGEGGIGKTRLAVEAASRLTDDFADGVWFVPLSGVEGRGQEIPRVLARAIARALDLVPDSTQDVTHQLVEYVRARNLVLVLDNLEQFLALAAESEDDETVASSQTVQQSGGAEWVYELLSNAPGVRLLVTSRTRLNLHSEYVMRLGGLEVPQDENAATAQAYSSVQLFLERAERAGISAGDLELTPIVRLCQMVEGLPLALELAASWMNRAAPAEMIQALQTNLDRLATAQRDVPAQHRSLRAVFENSWRLLSRAEQSALAQASVFQHRFTREAAERVMDVNAAAEVSGVTGGDDISQGLDALVEKSLVRWVAAHRVFRLHPLVRQYAQEKLLTPPRERVRQRHAFYFLEYIVERTAALFGPGTRNAIDEIYDALADILVAWDWCVQARETEKLAQACDTLAAFYEYAGLAGEGFALFERTVQTLEKSADVSRGLILRLELARARLLLRLGRHAEAHTLAERVLQEAEQSNHRELVAWSRYVRALALARLPDTEQELAELERAHDEARSTNQTRLEALCLVREGMVAMRAGEYRAAKNHTLQASEIFERVLDVRYTGGCFAMLGLIEFTLGEMQEAILVQTRAIEIADRIRDEYLKAVTLHNLGNTLASQGQYENALACMKQSEQIYRTVGTTALVIGSQAQAGLFLALLGRWVEARGTLEHVTRVADSEGMPRELGWANVGLAVLARRQGQLGDAVRFGRLALEPAMRWNDAHDRADAAIVLADTLIEQGALDEAEENYRAALALREQMQQTHLFPEAFVGLAHAAMQRGETETARAWIKKAWNDESLRLPPGPMEPFWIYWTGYQVMRALGDPRAERLVETAQMVLAEYASQISDLETRDQYLLVPWHRALLRATHASPSLPFFVFSDAAALRAQ